MIKKMRWRFVRVAMIAFFCLMVLVAGVINIGNYYVTTVRQDQIIEGIYRADGRPPQREGGGQSEAPISADEGEGGNQSEASIEADEEESGESGSQSETPVSADEGEGGNQSEASVEADEEESQESGSQSETPVQGDGTEAGDQSEGREEDPEFPDFAQPGRRQPEFAYTTRFFIVRCGADGAVEEVSTDFVASVTEEDARVYGEAVLKKSRSVGYYRRYRYHIYETEDQKSLIFLNCDREFEYMATLLITSAIVVLASLFVVFWLIFLLSKRAVAPFAGNIERQKQFITDAGHELKTPITSISTSADVLEMLYGENEWTENIRKQTGKLGKLVENLITLSRLDEETPFPEKTEFSLSEAAWESTEPFGAIARAQGKTLVQDIGEDVRMQGDRGSIQKLISILLDNAVKYSEGSEEIYFAVYEKRGKKYIETVNACRIRDPKELEHLFDRFYRPDSSRARATGGTGIGLSIAKAVAEAHGGKIYAEKLDEKRIRIRAAL